MSNNATQRITVNLKSDAKLLKAAKYYAVHFNRSDYGEIYRANLAAQYLREHNECGWVCQDTERRFAETL